MGSSDQGGKRHCKKERGGRITSLATQKKWPSSRQPTKDRRSKSLAVNQSFASTHRIRPLKASTSSSSNNCMKDRTSLRTNKQEQSRTEIRTFHIEGSIMPQQQSYTNRTPAFILCALGNDGKLVSNGLQQLGPLSTWKLCLRWIDPSAIGSFFTRMPRRMRIGGLPSMVKLVKISPTCPLSIVEDVTHVSHYDGFPPRFPPLGFGVKRVWVMVM
jgi:hypothetical protein